jgi:hypothetical protein
MKTIQVDRERTILTLVRPCTRPGCDCFLWKVNLPLADRETIAEGEADSAEEAIEAAHEAAKEYLTRHTGEGEVPS